MENKATLLLLNFVAVIITWVVAALTVAAWFAGITPPQKSWFITLLSLGMMPLLTADLLLFIWWAFRRRKLAILPLVVIILNVGFISSMLRIDLDRQERAQYPADLKIASYNMHAFAQRDLRGMLENLALYLDKSGVDIICFQEFKISESLPADTIARIFSRRMPYSVMEGNTTEMGIAIFSRFPISAKGFLHFDNTFNGAMWADIDAGSQLLRVFNAHFQTTSISQSERELESIKEKGITDYEGKRAFDVVMDRLHTNACKRTEQVEAVRAVMDTTCRAVIVCGDFNDTPASYTYKTIKRGLNDGFRECGHGYAYTFKPMMKLLRLDYIFYDKRYKGVWFDSPKLSWSDHNPVMLELSFWH